MTELTVGKPFPLKLTGDVFLRITGGTLMFIENFAAPTKKERDLFQDGAFDAGLYVHESGIAFFTIRFVKKDFAGPWSDTPVHYIQNDERELATFYSDCETIEGQKEKTLPFGLCMVDAGNGKIQELRMIGPPPSFFLKLRDVYRMQAEKSVAYDESFIMNEIYAKLSPEDMARKAQERIYIQRK